MESNRRLLWILLCKSMPKLKNSNLYLYVKHFPARLGWGIDISHSDKSFTRFLLTCFFLAHLGLYSAYSWYNPMIISFMLKFQPRKSCVTFLDSHSWMFCFANEPRTCKIDLFLKICECGCAYLGTIFEWTLLEPRADGHWWVQISKWLGGLRQDGRLLLVVLAPRLRIWLG